MYRKSHSCHMLIKVENSRETTVKFLSIFKRICCMGKNLLNPNGETERCVDTMTLSVAFHSLLTISYYVKNVQKGSENIVFLTSRIRVSSKHTYTQSIR